MDCQMPTTHTQKRCKHIIHDTRSFYANVTVTVNITHPRARPPLDQLFMLDSPRKNDHRSTTLKLFSERSSFVAHFSGLSLIFAEELDRLAPDPCVWVQRLSHGCSDKSQKSDILYYCIFCMRFWGSLRAYTRGSAWKTRINI